MSFDLCCKKCGARMVMTKTFTDSFGVTTVNVVCPNWRWYSLNHDKGVSYSRDTNIWSDKRPSILIKGDKAYYEHRGPPLTLCEGDTLTVDFKIEYK